MNSFSARFWSKVEKNGPDECWPWLGAHDGRGYGQFYLNGRTRRATQVSWELAHKKSFPKGKMCCHTCDNPPCVNPRHLWPGTMSENIIDSFQKGRSTAPSTEGRVANTKTHCWRGHEYTPENTRMTVKGYKACRECQRANERRIQSRPDVRLQRAEYEKRRRAALADKGDTDNDG